MNFTLKRREYRPDGIFSDFVSEDGASVFVNLDHAYKQADGSFLPKLAPGVYTFIRRFSPDHGYEVFTLPVAPNFMGCPVTWIEIHIGNFQKDSAGCTLIALAEMQAPGASKMVIHSKEAFAKFIELQKGIDSIQVTVLAA